MTASRFGTPTRVAVFSLVLLLALAACAKNQPQASPTKTEIAAPTPPPKPRVGACYRLSFTDAAKPSNDNSPVPCRRRHTAVTFHVGRINTVANGHLVAVDSLRVQRQLLRACPRKLTAYLGNREEAQRLSRFETVWFSPTLKEADEGAVWFRCDLVALDGGDRLAPLPRRTPGILKRPDALKDFGTCANTSPAKPSFVRLSCRHRHTWRAVESINLDRGAKYLGKAAGRDADARCRDAAANAAGNDLKFTWSFEWPTREQWKQGQRWGLCWLPGTD